jgi:hypothetical protein
VERGLALVVRGVDVVAQLDRQLDRINAALHPHAKVLVRVERFGELRRGHIHGHDGPYLLG